ncbi:alpha-glucosidase [Paenibacillus phyllosphaerae]|uniref:Alpha-glucosidase n=1 Tax=Paenibacillus phyllosphaerae TaxID=274593 RepID=A0A7W5FKI0_9BACL|nr:TIM-barrel domain-containing protein [Paenibacillus phyllosphaerae]MBB3107999.1 alpha-glucosidase [Paenibacillus phyllosphaerae]
MLTSETIHPDKGGTLTLGASDWRIGTILAADEREGAYYFRGENATLMLQPVNGSVVRVKLLPDHREDKHTTIAVQPEAFVPVASLLTEEPDGYRLALPEVTVAIRKENALLAFYTAAGELISDEAGLYRSGRGQYGCRKRMEPDSHVYGLGEKTGFLDKKGEKYDMWNSDVYDPHVPEIEALYVSIPFLIHFRYDKPAYGIFLDNPGRCSFDMRSGNDSYTFQTTSGTIDYYFVSGPDMKSVIQGYSRLTGTMDLPPAWAIGYHQSRYSYMSQEEVMTLAWTFREKQIPCDVIYLDIHYMDEYRVFTFDPVRFPRPQAMIEELKAMGIRIVPIVDPGVKKDPSYAAYREGIRSDYFCRKLEGELFIGNVWPGASAFPDFTEEEVRSWWGEQHRFYTDMGIHGIWNDMNEPAVFNESKTMDLDVVHRNDGRPKMHHEVHNLYGMLMSMATQQGLKQQLDGERPFVLTRAGYAGIQKYAATWTGDNRSFWEHLAMSIPMVLNLGLSGQPFSGPDIGGFAHHTSPELLARWTQAGAFYPYCRNHSVLESIRQEPWVFGPEIEDICRTYIRLRYSLLPYLYTLFHEAHETGLPVMRPLILEYPHDRQVYNCCDQFLVGQDLLVAPILRPSTEYRTVYLPAGEWIDYWSGERFAGGQHVMAHAPLERMPIYVRAGAVIAELRDESWKPVLDAGAQIVLTIRSAQAGTRVTGRWYEDDASTYAYEQGTYNLLEVASAFDEDAMTLDLRYLSKGMPNQRATMEIEVNDLNFVPKQLLVVTSEGDVELEAQGGSWSLDAASSKLKLVLSNAFEAITIKAVG